MLDMDFLSLLIMFLLKPTSLDLWNILFTVMVFCTPLLLTKAFILKPMKYGEVPLLMEFTGITIFPEAAGLRG